MTPHQPSRAARRAPRRVLVTGGAGFVGAALVRALLARGAEVVALDDLSAGRAERLPRHRALRLVVADVAAPGALAGALEEGPAFDALFHLAARVGVRAVLRDPEGCRRANRAGVEACLAAVRGLSPARRPRLYAASSSEVYRDAPRLLAEDAPLREVDGRGRWAYAGSKLEGERRLDAAADLWPAARAPLHLRFFNVVGPGQDADSGMVLPTFVEHAIAGAPIPVHGDGRSVRTFAHVDEVARTLVELAAHPAAPGGALNVGGVARASALALAQEVARQAGSAAGVRFVDPREHCGAGFEPVRWRQPDLARLRALGVRVPALGLEQIVADTLARHAAATPDRSPACASPASSRD